MPRRGSGPAGTPGAGLPRLGLTVLGRTWSRAVHHDQLAGDGPGPGTFAFSMRDWGRFRLVPPSVGASAGSTWSSPGPSKDPCHTPGGPAMNTPGLAGRRAILGRGAGRLTPHIGSNTYWFCTIWVAPAERKLRRPGATQRGRQVRPNMACSQAGSGTHPPSLSGTTRGVDSEASRALPCLHLLPSVRDALETVATSPPTGAGPGPGRSTGNRGNRSVLS